MEAGLQLHCAHARKHTETFNKWAKASQNRGEDSRRSLTNKRETDVNSGNIKKKLKA